MQAGMARAAHTYYQTQVQSQSPVGLVVMLYDGALRFMRLAADAMRRRDMLAKREGMSRSMAILSELQNTLDLEAGGDVSKSLDSLYAYVMERMVDANVKCDPAPIDESIRLIQPLRDAWVAVANMPTPPVAGRGER